MSNDTFSVDVPGIGTFTFWRRNERHIQIIDAEKFRLLDGYAPSDLLDAWATVVTVLDVLMVRVPDGWDIDATDPLDDGALQKILVVYLALRDAEDLLNNHHHLISNPALPALWN